MGKFLAELQQAKEARIELAKRIAKAEEESDRRGAAAFEREKRTFDDALGIVQQVVENLQEMTDLTFTVDPFHKIANFICSPGESGYGLLAFNKETMATVYHLTVPKPQDCRYVITVALTVAVITNGGYQAGSVEPWRDDARTILHGHVFLKDANSSNGEKHVFWLSEAIDPFAADLDELAEAIAAGIKVGEAFFAGFKANTSAATAAKTKSGLDAANKLFDEYLAESAPKTLYPTLMPGGKRPAKSKRSRRTEIPEGATDVTIEGVSA